MSEKTACPFCGCEATEGTFYAQGVSRGRFYTSGTLYWQTDQPVPRKKPLKLFGKTFFPTKHPSVCLLSQDGSARWFAYDVPCDATGIYCPQCKKIYAAFNAPDALMQELHE